MVIRPALRYSALGWAGVAMRIWSLTVALFLSCCALAQPASPVFRGSWIATAGPTQVFRGRWSGQSLPHRPNAAHGSWTLQAATGQTVAEGTWAAEKTHAGWQGSWTARSQQGQSFSGSWTADIAGWKGKTFEDMLQHTLEEQVAGSWRSGRYQGNWWLKSWPSLARPH
jgi:hypothetical protein